LADIPAGSCRRFGADPELIPVLEDLRGIPKSLKLGGGQRQCQIAEASDGSLDMSKVLGKMNAGDTAYAYIPVRAEAEGYVKMGFGADWWMQVWVNGELCLDTTAGGNIYGSVECENHLIEVDLRAGDNLVVVRVISGNSGCPLLAAAGPVELEMREKARTAAEEMLPWKQRPPQIRVSQAELLVKTPDDRTAIFGGMRYTRKSGQEMLFVYAYQVTSDVPGDTFYCTSTDNGCTWSEPTLIYRYDPANLVCEPIHAPSGPVAHANGGNRNPLTGEVVLFSDTRTLPAGASPDLPPSYWVQSSLTYAVSSDDGRTAGDYRPLFKNGPEFDERHPFDGLFLGQNQVYGMYEALFLDADTFLTPFEMSVLDADGTVYNPYRWDHSQVVVLIARRYGDAWTWDCAPPLRLDAHSQSTRGLCEPTLAELEDGRILLVMRGANASRPELPCWKWFAVSADRGRSWSKPEPWTYDTRERFFSPSSISKFFSHSSGRLFWFGNIVPTNEDAYSNGRRYPLVIGEVDRQTGLLIRDTLTVIADREPGMHKSIQFSNFGIYEDRLTKELVVCLPHFYPNDDGTHYTGDLFRYRIGI